MKTGKRILAIFLSVLMVALCAPLTFADDSVEVGGQCGVALSWTFDGAGTLTISGYGEMDDYYGSDAPWTSLRQQIQTVNITATSATIGAYAFAHCYNLKTVRLPDYFSEYGLKRIGVDAFYCCTSLKEINLTDSIEAIDDYAFVGCTALKEIVIPQSVTTLGRSPFNFCISMERIANCAMTTVCASTEVFDLSYPEGWDAEKASRAATWIEENGFFVLFPDESNDPSAVTEEMITSFNEEFGTDFVSPEDLLSFRAMFEQLPAEQKLPLFYCNIGSAEKAYCDEHGIEYVLLDAESPMQGVCGSQAFWSYDAETATLTVSGTGATREIVSNEESIYSGAETVVVEEGITEIGFYTFNTFRNISDISFPESLVSIGGRAFDSLRISAVSIPKNVAVFDSHAFEMCGNIERFDVAPENETYSSDDFGCLFNKDKTVLVRYATGRHGDYTVPDSVETIGYAAFQNAWYLGHVTLGSSVKLIEAYAFFQSSLESITIPNGVERIKHEAFWRCGLSQVTLPASVAYVGYECFNECGLKSITILNPDCVIECTPVGTEAEGEDCGDKTIPSPIICGYLNSTAQRFAETYDRAFVDVTKETVLDADTGIAITYDAGDFDPAVQINITEIPTGDENSRSWEITPTLNGAKVQPQKPVQVRLPIPAGWDKSRIVVIHVDENENITYPEFTIEGNYVVFWASSFSEYRLDQEDPHTHDYTDHEEVIKPATCTEAGTKKCYCSCGDFVEGIIDALGHDRISHDAKAPTCIEKGWEAYETCSRCDYTTLKELDTVDHLDADNDGYCDTCNEMMEGGDHCPKCGKIHNGNFFDKLTGFFHKIIYRLTHLFKR